METQPILVQGGYQIDAIGVVGIGCSLNQAAVNHGIQCIYNAEDGTLHNGDSSIVSSAEETLELMVLTSLMLH